MNKKRQRNLAQIFSMFGNEHENHSLVPYMSLIWNKWTYNIEILDKILERIKFKTDKRKISFIKMFQFPLTKSSSLIRTEFWDNINFKIVSINPLVSFLWNSKKSKPNLRKLHIK